MNGWMDGWEKERERKKLSVLCVIPVLDSSTLVQDDSSRLQLNQATHNATL